MRPTPAAPRGSLARKLYDFAAFQVAWFVAVLGAARGHEWIGTATIALVVAIHVAIQRDRRGETAFVLASLPLGIAVNAVMTCSGAVVAIGSDAHSITAQVGPAWLAAMWPLFATLFRDTMAWMRGRYVLGALLGAVGAPLSYYAAARTGAVVLDESATRWIGLTALTWSPAMIALLALRERLAARPGQGANEIERASVEL